MNKHTIKTDKAYFVAPERVFNTYSGATKYALSVFIVCLLETSGNLLERLREKSEFYFSPHPKHSPQQIRILNSPLFLY